MKKMFFFMTAILVLTSCAIFDKANDTIPSVKTENSSGIFLIDIPGKERVFNGEFDLGTAGFGMRSFNTLIDNKFKSHPPLSTVDDPETGSCLKIASSPGRIACRFMAREIFIPGNTKFEVTFKAKLKKSPVSGELKTFFLDFRRVNSFKYGITQKERYWVKGGSLRLNEKWQTFSKVFTTPKENNYYRFTIWAKLKEYDKQLPDIFLDSIDVKIMPEKLNSRELPQVAVYTDKTAPVYQKNEAVKYKIEASFQKTVNLQELISIDIVDDQTFEVVSSHNVTLIRQSNNIYTGQLDFIPKRFGSFSTRIRQDEKLLDRVGGDFALVHPAVDSPMGTVGWGIGINGQGFGYMNRKIFPDYKGTIIFSDSHTMQDYYTILKAAGIKTDRPHSFNWNDVEPEKGKFNFNLTDYVIKGNKKNGIDTIVVLGSSFFFHNSNDIPDWAKPLCAPHKVTPEHSRKGLIPPTSLWKRYCRALMERYKGDVDVWEVLNEPNGGMSIEEYMKTLKASYEVAKSISPSLKIIGPCPTGDGQVPRFAGWSKGIIAAGGEKYMDGFSYHPYGAGNDYQKGQFFKATNLIDSIRKWLNKKDMPIYNTESFYLFNQKELCSRWTASTGLRHYIITLGNGAKLCAAFQEDLIFKATLNPHINPKTPFGVGAIPGTIVPALSNLSYHLKGMTRGTPLKLNKFINSYVFSGSKDGTALGVLWDLRPQGSGWTSSASNKGLNLYDMWGNPIEMKSDGIHLGLNPVYLVGPLNKVREFLQKSKFQLPEPLKLTGRFFKNDLYLEAKNMSAMQFSPDVEFVSVKNLNMPKSAQFAFAENIHNTVRLPGAVKTKDTVAGASFNVLVNNDSIGFGKIKLLSKSQAYELPFTEDKPLSLALPEGSSAKIMAEKDYLSLTVSVKSSNIISPEQFKPWTGDAVEVFVDCAPFTRLEQDLIRAGKGILPVWQYIVPAQGNKDEKAFWTNNKSSHAAKIATSKTSDGYSISIKIPWKALKPGGNRYGIYGIDIEVDHVEKTGKAQKETLSGKKGQSFKKRLHYPLFRVPKDAKLSSGLETHGANELINASFEKKREKSEEPTGWTKRWDRKKAIYDYGNFGYNGTKGVRVRLSEPSTKHVKAWPQKFKCNPDGKTKLLVEGLVKAENIQKIKLGSYGTGLRFFGHFYDDVNKKHMDNIGIGVNESITGSFGWKKMQCIIPVPKGATSCQLSCGLSTGVTGTVYFDDIHIKTIRSYK
jgi:cellulose/xylan binding protein with CBM9 domain/glycosyl hydrolase family 42 (putative beta-galactosidase)